MIIFVCSERLWKSVSRGNGFSMSNSCVNNGFSLVHVRFWDSLIQAVSWKSLNILFIELHFYQQRVGFDSTVSEHSLHTFDEKVDAKTADSCSSLYWAMIWPSHNPEAMKRWALELVVAQVPQSWSHQSSCFQSYPTKELLPNPKRGDESI